MKIGKRVIREADLHHHFDSLTTSEILAFSSNIGATKIAMQLGDKKLLDTLRSFGFGEKTGVDLPGEAKGILQPLPWHDHLLANISFGHGLTATPLQIANAYAVIANGGWLKAPSIVKSVQDRESGEVKEFMPRTMRRVLNDEQVAKMRLMLAGVTSDLGTGASARVPGFPVAGKTGTAQKVNPVGRGYLKGGYVSSFAGFIPTNDPRFVIYVSIDQPQKGYYGGAVAAPVFSHIATFAVRRAGLAPVLIQSANLVPQARRMPQIPSRPTAVRDIAASETDPAFATSTVPDLSGLTLREVMGRVTGTNVKLHVHGQGFVTHSVPPAGSKLGLNQDLGVYLNNE